MWAVREDNPKNIKFQLPPHTHYARVSVYLVFTILWLVKQTWSSLYFCCCWMIVGHHLPVPIYCYFSITEWWGAGRLCKQLSQTGWGLLHETDHQKHKWRHWYVSQLRICECELLNHSGCREIRVERSRLHHGPCLRSLLANPYFLHLMCYEIGFLLLLFADWIFELNKIDRISSINLETMPLYFVVI